MSTEKFGDRIGKQGKLGIGTSAAIFDSTHQRILLQQRADNGQWGVPGGYMEPGESLTEACAREVLEETGLRVKVKRLICVFSNPNWLVEYPDGNKWQFVNLHFEAETLDGNLTLGPETIDLHYFAQEEIAGLDMHLMDRLRIADSFAADTQTIIHDAF
jgi:ADP-ribose pyrophosphatase YjhB (NUDIX family)